MVVCKKNIQKWVSIYEICECDIGAPDIQRFPRVDGLSTGPPGYGHHRMSDGQVMAKTQSWGRRGKLDNTSL